MPAKDLIWIRLGEHVGRLGLAADGIDSDLVLVNVVMEVVVLNIDVFGAWTDLWYSCNFNCAAVVFKNSSVNGWLGAAEPEA